MPTARSRKQPVRRRTRPLTPSARSPEEPRRPIHAWAIALDAARRYAGDCLDPNSAHESELDDVLDDVVAAVRAQTGPRDEQTASDRESDEHRIGIEAGYLFGVALASVMRGPWDGLDLCSWAPNAPVPAHRAGGAR